MVTLNFNVLAALAGCAALVICCRAIWPASRWRGLILAAGGCAVIIGATLVATFPATIREWCATQDPFRVIGAYVDLNDQGIGSCPFGQHHAGGQDAHASFKVYQPNTTSNYCWCCYAWQQGGSVFDFLRYWYNLDAREMWRRLQAREVQV